MRSITLVIFLFFIARFSATSQDEEFRVYTEHPRLILTPQRLRLLKRERERESARWKQFDLLVKGSASLPEPGFALALYYAISDDAASGKRAVQWALAPSSTDLRQVALVYDWCQPILSAQDAAALLVKLRQLTAKRAGDDIASQRDRMFAWIAIDDPQHSEEVPLQQTVRQWWRMNYATSLADGRTTLALADIYPLLETMHAIRDNLKIDLRDTAAKYFTELPEILIFANYPVSYSAPENDFRVPMEDNIAQPDLHRAALARAAGLAMVAYDTNGLENQFLQGWLIRDRFSLLSTFGSPYEFLWANPYQPGLSYFQLPLVLHDQDSGALFIRSTWDEDADWFGMYGGKAESYRDGRVAAANQTNLARPAVMQVGDASIVSGSTPLRFSMQGGPVLVIGLKPRHPYLVETDDEEMRQIITDGAGTLLLDYPSSRTAGVRIHEESEGTHGKGGA